MKKSFLLSRSCSFINANRWRQTFASPVKGCGRYVRGDQAAAAYQGQSLQSGGFPRSRQPNESDIGCHRKPVHQPGAQYEAGQQESIPFLKIETAREKVVDFLQEVIDRIIPAQPTRKPHVAGDFVVVRGEEHCFIGNDITLHLELFGSAFEADKNEFRGFFISNQFNKPFIARNEIRFDYRLTLEVARRFCPHFLLQSPKTQWMG